jgi:hypothetical protein
MPRYPKPKLSDPDAIAVVYDDGGSGLLDACRTRFAPFDCEVSCDERHTVWVKRANGSLSVGLPPWMLNRSSIDELLEGVTVKLKRQTVRSN